MAVDYESDDREARVKVVLEELAEAGAWRHLERLRDYIIRLLDEHEVDDLRPEDFN